MRRREYENIFVRHRQQQSLRDTVHRVIVALAIVLVIGFAIWAVLELGLVSPG